MGKSKRTVKETKSRGFLIRLSLVAPLEIVIGILNLCAIFTSFLNLDRRCTLEELGNWSMGEILISSEHKAFEANSASANILKDIPPEFPPGSPEFNSMMAEKIADTNQRIQFSNDPLNWRNNLNTFQQDLSIYHRLSAFKSRENAMFVKISQQHQ